jgi:hypothetical protein
MSVSPPRDHLRSFYPDFEPQFQIAAIKAIVELHKQDSARRNKSIVTLISEAETRSTFEDRAKANDEGADLLQETFYAEAAYSMSAVGMLAPFLETIFKQAFFAIGEQLYSLTAPPPQHERWTMPDAKKWDCHYVLRNGKPALDLVAGIMQISEALGLLSRLPKDFGLRLGALFSYRNAMFHNGFEWPRQERKKFEAKIKTQRWPDDWFDKAWVDRGFKDEHVWLFYLSDDFISKTVAMIEDALDGLGSFVGERRKALQEVEGN